MRKNLLTVLILFTIPYLGIAQVFSNLDFEYGVYKAQPRKWAMSFPGIDKKIKTCAFFKVT